MLPETVTIDPKQTWPSYLERLNDSQRNAALIAEGPLMVLAGAGSGKTKLLTARIAHLIDGLGISPHRILAMTFTNKAAKEMQKRVHYFLKDSNVIGSPEIGTFHAICANILRREISKTPFSKQFVINDEADQLALIKPILKKLNIDTEDKAFSPKNFQNKINSLKCEAIEPHQFFPKSDDAFGNYVKRVYTDYQTVLFSSNAIDFGEILCMLYRILRDNVDIRTKYQTLYQYIHVDEYQDTNHVQYLLLSMLAKKEFGGHENICVVGDADQCIYQWRGANISNILNFEKDYPSVRSAKLEQNYRSMGNIVTAANEVIRNNIERKDKTMWTSNEPGNLINCLQRADERSEAETVVSEIRRLVASNKCAYSDCVILYRNHFQSRQFEDVLLRNKIPYQVIGTRFYDRKEVKDIMSYFRAILNKDDCASLKRIINTPTRGIGDTTVETIDGLYLQLLRKTPTATYWDAVKEATTTGAVTIAITKKLNQFVLLLERLRHDSLSLSLAELFQLVIAETKYVAALQKEYGDEAEERLANLEELRLLLENFDESQTDKANLLSQFLEQAALVQAESNDVELSVKLMTCHAAKGLEFLTVFLVGMEEGLFPSTRARNEEDDNVEEERRLCYVGMTRARERLYLSYAARRMVWGRTENRIPARFFGEISKKLRVSSLT